MAHPAEDTELLQRYVAQKSDEAVAELVRRHLPLVYSAALRQLGGNVPSAEDVTQMVFATMVRRARALTAHPALTGWLYTTTFHLAQKTLRSEWRRQRREQTAQALQAQMSEANAAISWEAIRPILDGAMLGLSESDRSAVLFRFFENRSYQEIGSKLGLTENSARMRVERALASLEKSIAKYGITSTAGAIGLVLANQAVGAVPAALTTTITTGVIQATTSTGSLLFMSSTTTKVAATSAFAGALVGLVLQNQTIARQKSQIDRLQSAAVLNENHSREQLAALQRRAGAGATSARQPDPMPGPGGARPVHVSQILRDHPEYLALMRKQARREALSLYAAGLASLDLPPDKLSRLKDLLAERRLASDASYLSAGQAGLEPGTPAFRQARQQSVQDLTGQIDGLIGAEGDAQLEYARSLSQTSDVVNSDFQPEFADAGVPLSSAQLNRLAVLLHDNGGRAYYAAQNISTVVDPSTWLSPANNLMLSQASAILNPAQLEVLRGHMAEEGQRRAITANYTSSGPIILEP